MRTEGNVIERLERYSIPDPNSGCVLWVKSSRNAKCRYGSIWFKGRTRYAHRVSYEVFKGKIPRGRILLHSCDTPECINPDHLRHGTHLQNMQDASNKGRLVGSRKRGV